MVALGDDDLQDHASFVIEGNGGFWETARSNGWPGDGSSANPYQISGLMIQNWANTVGIAIRNTTSFFQISDCSMVTIDQENSSMLSRAAAVELTNVANGRLSNLSISGYVFGIIIVTAHDVRVDNCSVHDSLMAEVFMESSSRLVIENNTLWGARGSGIDAYYCDQLTIQCNNASYNGYCGINLSTFNSNSVIRWNLASRNGDVRTSSVASALHVVSEGNAIYGNVLVGPGGYNSPPAGSSSSGQKSWNSTKGYGNYYGGNYDPAAKAYTSFLGKPQCSLVDNDKNGISDKPFTIKTFGPSGGVEPSVDHYPLISPASPPRNLRAEMSEDRIVLTWDLPVYTTSPVGHYTVMRDDGESRIEFNTTELSFIDVFGVNNWHSFHYTVKWVGKYVSSGPSNSVSVQHPDRPSLTIITNLDTSEVTLYNLTSFIYSSLDPRSVTVAWRGYDSNSDAMSYSVRMDDEEWLDNGNSEERTFTNLSEGTHIITIKATDDDGNQVEASRSFEVYRYIEMSLDCRPHADGNTTKLRLDGRAWDAATGTGMADLPISVAYSIDRGSSWAFSAVTSGTDGRFEFVLELETEVIHGLMFTAEIRDLNDEVHYFIEEGSYAAFVPQGQEHLFMVHSERTISELSYSSKMMRFDVSAGNDEQRFTSILIPKAVCGMSAISMTLDGMRYDGEITEDGDYWVMIIQHNVSSHHVLINIASPSLLNMTPGDLPLIALGAVGVAALVGVTALAWRRRRSGGRPQ